jgi:hypothetical protein
MPVNRMAVRVFERLAQVGRDGLLQARRNRVLKGFGLGIDLAPIETQHACKEQFHETVTADDSASFIRATSGQPRASAVLITDPHLGLLPGAIVT